MGRGTEIGSEAQVKRGNYHKKGGPEYLFPSSSEYSSKNKNTPYRRKQTDIHIQQRHNEPTNELAARPSPSGQILQQRWIHPRLPDSIGNLVCCARRRRNHRIATHFCRRGRVREWQFPQRVFGGV